MSGGGGGGLFPTNPVFTDPVNGMSYPDSASLNTEIAARQANDLATSDAATATANATTAQNESDYQTRLTNAKQTATDNANTYFKANGYDPNAFASDLASAINYSSQGVPDLAPTPITSFSPNLGASIIQSANTGDQTKATSAVDSLFAPTYASDNISNSWLAPAATTALSTQFDPLASQLTNAYKRGTLNDVGYAAAQKALTDKQTTAQSTVDNLGNNILAADRTGVNNYITGAKTDASNVNVNNYGAFDPTKYASGASDLVSGYKNNFSGDLGNAIGSTSFADLGSLLNAGGVVQGATDPTATNPNVAPGASGATGGAGGVSDAFIAQQALAGQKRGLGTQGAF